MKYNNIRYVRYVITLSLSLKKLDHIIQSQYLLEALLNIAILYASFNSVLTFCKK